VFITALNGGAENLYVALTGRSMRHDLSIVSRTASDAAVPKLLQAGADRVVNPQDLGGARLAALAVQPRVAEFLDVVMHDGSLEFRLQEIGVPSGSPVVGQTLRSARVHARTGRRRSMSTGSARNVVLVHGGFVDGSGWQGVYDALTADGYRVAIVQNPTLSPDDDAAVTRRVIDDLDGPVVLVGHSYGGAVMTASGYGCWPRRQSFCCSQAGGDRESGALPRSHAGSCHPRLPAGSISPGAWHDAATQAFAGPGHRHR
jgi:Alpha/beta hydrolase family/TrkA-N domain